MDKRMTPTLALVLAGGLAAGIALARPAAAPPAAGSAEQATVTAPARSGGYVSRDGATGRPPSSSSPRPAVVLIQDFAYSGATTVAPGQVLSITNQDGPAHTLTAADGSFDTGDLAGGRSITFAAPITPGTYAYFCTIHPSMQGSLTVQ